MDSNTVKIRMRHQISGARHDGRAWPPPDTDFEVPEWEAHDLFRGGHADPAGQAAKDSWKAEQERATADDRHPSKLNRDPRPVSQVEAETPGAELAGAMPEAEVRGTGEGAEEGEPDGGAHRAGAESGMPAVVTGGAEEQGRPGPGSPDGAPAPSAPKQAWVDYAVSQGADVHAANGMSKADLMSRYGGRL